MELATGELTVGVTEIVSVDSMQVYRGMDIGTAKPSIADRERVRHHMIDLVEPGEPFSVAQFQVQGRAALDGIAGRSLVVGGSGLHLRALVDPLEFPPTDSALRAELETLDLEDLARRLLAVDPGAAAVVDMGNRRRVLRALEVVELAGETPTQRAGSVTARAVADYEPVIPVAIVGLDPGDELQQMVVARVDAMLDAGWPAEAAALADRLGPTAAAAIGYRELIDVAAGVETLQDARRIIVGATMALAKRQRTYFRRDPRVRWLPWQPGLMDRVGAVAAALEEAKWSS
jgi:tRNA dimethylallyltransferase